ncbi:hypothetical protein PHYBOEH_007329 [Phytophthora boehmeriae]|uniref:Uncharacterized protein n=1 Tax=Phytophthora boehmeriae TaxID=109152 RepID=A0A8T1X6L3_9STRA|nr:hypothetical protein PHYBOEH_007329 [Phytophthora boehmeriae]
MKMELLDDAVALPPLRRLLSLLPGDDSAAEREASALSLVVNLQQLPPQSVRQALQSLVHMENYSQSLQRYPLVKQAFWEQVLASDLMVGGPTTRRQELRLQSERFPRLVLDFSRKKLTTELLEVLAEFFACLKSQETSIQAPFSGVNAPRAVSTMRFVPLAVKFVRCRLTADTIELLLPLLRPTPRDSTVVEVGGKVQYCVTSLDLSENGMSSAELMALAELLTKCRWMRDRRRCGDQAPILEELVLEKIVGRSLTTESWAAFRAFVCAAFGITPTLVGLQYSSIGNKMPLKRLSLANNSLNRHHLACICSALRASSYV